jgi:WD40 repeat protein
MFRSGTHLRTLKGHSQSITGMDVIPLSGHLVSCSMDCIIKVWDYTAGVVLRQYIHHEELRCLALRCVVHWAVTEFTYKSSSLTQTQYWLFCHKFSSLQQFY